MNFPKMPSAGTNKISGIYKTVEDIIKFLPSLVTRGDGRTTAVNESIGGRIISALPQATSSAPVFGGKTQAVDNGMWHFEDIQRKVGEVTKRFLRVYGGYYIRNGLYVPFTMGNVRNIHYTDIDFNAVFTTNNTYYIHVYQEWDRTYDQWKSPELRATTEAPPQYESSTIFGYCLLGWVTKNMDPQIVCLNQKLPVMFVTGRCLGNEI